MVLLAEGKKEEHKRDPSTEREKLNPIVETNKI